MVAISLRPTTTDVLDNVSGVNWILFHGDSRLILPTMAESSIDCIVTSPPYFWLRDYSIDNQIGQEATIEAYVESIADVMDCVYRLLKPSGTAFLNIGDTYYSGKGESKSKDTKNRKRRFGLRAVDISGGMGIGLQRKSQIGIPWRVAIELMRRKWVLRSSIIWVNQLRTPETVSDRPRQSYEYIFMLAKGRSYYFNRSEIITQEATEDVWFTKARSSLPKGVDTAPFPEELVERCLAIGCPSDGVVLDPFAGSGTTMRVALRTGRTALGIEINPNTFKYASDKLSRFSGNHSPLENGQ